MAAEKPNSKTKPPAQIALPAPDDVAILEQPDQDELVSIFNKNPPGGDFVHHVYTPIKNGDGTVVGRKVASEFRAEARNFSNVPRWLAELWKKQAPHAIVDGQAVSRGKSAPPASSEEIAGLKSENVELKKRLDNMAAMIEELRKSPGGDKS